MGKQAAWAKTPHRRLMAECPDCDEILYVDLRVHFTHRGGHVYSEVRAEPVEHRCDPVPSVSAA